MYTIGQLSRIGRVSTKTLRFYDEIGLLKPAYIDEANQYRYYTEDHAAKILSIAELKEYGFRLEEIKVIIDRQDVQVFMEFLKHKIVEIDKEVQRSMELKENIIRKIRDIESGGGIMDRNDKLRVELKERDAMVVMSRREKTGMENISNLIGKVFEEIYRTGLQPAGPVMTLYYDKDFNVENADMEVCIPVSSSVDPEKSGYLRELNGGLHVYTTFTGPYSRLGEAYALLTRWMEENGYTCAGVPFEAYIEGPGSGKSPNEFVTEVWFPIKK